MTTFSVVFVQKLLYNAGKNSVKVKEKKQIEYKRKTGKAKRIKFKKNIRSCFRGVGNELNDLTKLKKGSEKIQKIVKNCKKLQN